MLLYCLILTVIQACSYFPKQPEPLSYSNFSVKNFSDIILPLDLNQNLANNQTAIDYLDYYDLIPNRRLENIHYTVGYLYPRTLTQHDKKIVCHVFQPKNASGTIVALHGYFDHVGSLNNFVNEATKKNYRIFACDMLGHGFSTGDRGDTGGIENAANFLTDLVDGPLQEIKGEKHLLGFSTGGAIAFEYVRTVPENSFKTITLVSPLIRHDNWSWGKFAHAVISPFANRVRRLNTINSHNEAYANFTPHDPLQVSYVSFNFLANLYQWNKSIEEESSITQKMLIVQGESDSVVDWKYNLPFISQNAEKADIYMIPGAFHQILNESEKHREPAFNKIFTFISQN